MYVFLDQSCVLGLGSDISSGKEGEREGGWGIGLVIVVCQSCGVQT